MIDPQAYYSGLYAHLASTPLASWAHTLPHRLSQVFAPEQHGHLLEWLTQLADLPTVQAERVELSSNSIQIGARHELNDEQYTRLECALRALHPWRKGPFDFFGLHIDTEWRSDWKWARLQPHIQSLRGRTVLDVGCGSGYHGWRMAGEGARLVVGLEPFLLYVMQYLAARIYLKEAPVYVLPLTFSELPLNTHAFDTVFSMGVLYHCRSPLDHMLELRGCLRSGGELILESLVIPGELGQTLLPAGRYAKMRNVWIIPSCKTLEAWLQCCGFKHIRLLDVSITSAEEQRATPWMRFESLCDFLDPSDATKTIEGYPAPRRAMFVASV